jgi:hypothetical protein
MITIISAFNKGTGEDVTDAWIQLFLFLAPSLGILYTGVRFIRHAGDL